MSCSPFGEPALKMDTLAGTRCIRWRGIAGRLFVRVSVGFGDETCRGTFRNLFKDSIDSLIPKGKPDENGCIEGGIYSIDDSAEMLVKDGEGIFGRLSLISWIQNTVLLVISRENITNFDSPSVALPIDRAMQLGQESISQDSLHIGELFFLVGGG